jgi:hypothetical protein
MRLGTLPACMRRQMIVNFIPEEIHVLATGLATYESSDSTTAKVTYQ